MLNFEFGYEFKKFYDFEGSVRFDNYNNIICRPSYLILKNDIKKKRFYLPCKTKINNIRKNIRINGINNYRRY